MSAATIEMRQESFVQGADGRAGRVTAQSAVPGGTSRNGLPEPRRYVYRGTGEDTLTGHLYQTELDAQAEAALYGRQDDAPAAKPGPSKPGRKAAARCPDCRQPKPDHLAACSQAPVATPALEDEPGEPDALDLIDERVARVTDAQIEASLGEILQLASAEPEPEPDAPKPARRCRKCTYMTDTNSHRIVCGGGK